MSIKKMIIAYIVCFFLQVTFTDLIAVMGTGPDLILILTVVLCYMYEESYPAMICGTAFAFLHDLLLSQYIGIYALAILLTGAFVMLISRFFNRENMLPLTGVLAAGTFICSLIQWIVYVLGPSEGSILLMLRIQPVQIIYDMIIGVIMFLVIMKYSRREKKSRYYL